MSERVIELATPEDTSAQGEALGRALRGGDLVGLVGNLGAGKTLFTQGLARGLGVPSEVAVVSPTFTLINEYDGGRVRLYHADLYRIERERELDELGLDEMCRRGDGAVVIEWADRFPVLPRDSLEIRIEMADGDGRTAYVTAGGETSRALLERWLGASPSP